MAKMNYTARDDAPARVITLELLLDSSTPLEAIQEAVNSAVDNLNTVGASAVVFDTLISEKYNEAQTILTRRKVSMWDD